MYCDSVAAPGAFEDPLAPGAKGDSRSTLRPYGTFGIVAPFNYPMVLGAAPAVAAMLAGNAVVLKPSHLGPASAQAFVDLMRDCGLPPGVLNVVHGGDTAGRALIGGAIDGAVFTGSAEVGLEIVRAMQGGRYPRPAIAEMGGNNPVVVTDSADLELAAEGIAVAAFGASGQRCSACSRVIVTQGASTRLLELLAERARAIAIGDPVDPSSFAGPLITREAQAQFENVVAHVAGDGELVAGGGRTSSAGHYAEATVIQLPRGHALTRRENFMPVVSVVEVPDFERALVEANATDLGLTAGIYTGDRDEARAYLARAEAGCVNVNVPRAGTTGWWPGVQTFGGWKGSGSTGKQAFGRWYVGQFAREQCRTVAAGFDL
jgi:1-pyrroline-5-carboxylate dehydrogenase